MPRDVIMPALGMAQDSGLIVAWHKEPGDAVAEGDILFEVETDKATMEVEAQTAGFLSGVSAMEGDDVPVGQVIAQITDTRGDAAPVEAQPDAETTSASDDIVPDKLEAPVRPTAAVPATDRILASPKARRLALEEGLDLALLAKSGHTQPFHVQDLEILRGLAQKSARPTIAASRRLTAQIAADGFADFAKWAAQSANLSDRKALLAGLVAACFGRETVVTVESFGQTASYKTGGHLSAVAVTDEAPSVLVRDLRFSAINAVEMGPEETPVLTLSRNGDGLCITLECAAVQLTASVAIALLSDFAGRMEQPLRHLL
jgi:pyruvate dehydrogenase E2 component (dihydrolipoamide acetyltransferase)/2-oxoglutarate dehydrogenase E2 component (dihydrolipoamide succinyltransferase)